MIITKTPLRITFAGGGSDLASYYENHKSTCISATINKYVYVLVKKRFDKQVYLKYSDNEVVDVNNLDDIQHDFIRETLKYMGVDYGIEIINWADIPTKGTGLGSSSSFLVGLLLAIHTLEGRAVSKKELAEQACKIEIDLCEKPIGVQDQFAAAFGGFNEMIFTKNSKEVFTVPFNDQTLRNISDHLSLFFTGITRESKEILSVQNKNLKHDTMLQAMHDNVKLAEQLARDLFIQKSTSIKTTLQKNWELKKQFVETISNTKLDIMHEKALKAGGAFAGKIIGAGGGGFFMFWSDDQQRLRNALGDYQELPFIIDKYGSRVVINMENLSW